MNDSQPLALTKPLWLGGVTIFAGLSLLGCATSEGHPALQFLLDVPVDWEETRVLHGEIGEFLTMVRKDRNSRDWYLGSITNESPRALETDCAFLEEGVDYVAEIYADGADRRGLGDEPAGVRDQPPRSDQGHQAASPARPRRRPGDPLPCPWPSDREGRVMMTTPAIHVPTVVTHGKSRIATGG